MGCKNSVQVIPHEASKEGAKASLKDGRWDAATPPPPRTSAKKLDVGVKEVSASMSLVSSSHVDAETIKVADYVAQCLVDAGVTHVFGGHGGAVVPLIDSICAHPKLTWVYCRCELNASMAAAAYSKLKMGLGVCLGTSGPGASHLTTGLLDAELDKCPVLCLTGLKSSDKVGISDFQDIGQTELFKAAGISFSSNIIHKGSVQPLLTKAIHSALTGHSCSHVALPFDIQQMKINKPLDTVCRQIWDDEFKNVRLPKNPHPDDVASCALYVVRLHSSGGRCLIAVGPRAAAAGAEILELSKTLEVPIVTSLDAKGIITEDDPSNVGVIGIFGNPGMEAAAELVRTADCVISIGGSEYSQLVLSSHGVQERSVIEIDLSSNLLDKSCTPECVLLGDIAGCCKALTKAVAGLGDPRMKSKPTQTSNGRKLSDLGDLDWGSNEELKAEGFDASHLSHRPVNYEVPHNELTTGFCHPGRVLKLLSPKLAAGSTICVDVGDVTLWTSLCLCLTKPGQRMLASMRLGTMGYALCSAMAACALRGAGEHHIVAIAGDGGVQMSLNELATLQQMQVKQMLLIVFVNKKLGRVKNEVWGPAGVPAPAGCDILAPDFCKLADAYGGTGLRLSSSDPATIEKTLDHALSCSGVCILEVIQDPNVKPLMTKRMASKTGMTTRPSEQLPPHPPETEKVAALPHKPQFQGEPEEGDLDGYQLCSSCMGDEAALMCQKVWTSEPWVFPTGPVILADVDVAGYVNRFHSETMVLIPPEETHAFNHHWRSNFRRHFSGNAADGCEIQEFLATGKSNGWPMRLQIMCLPPNMWFKCHATPNIEFEYMLGGRLHEIRLLNHKANADFGVPEGTQTGPWGPDLSNLMKEKEQHGAPLQWAAQSFSKGDFFKNETGSVHQSFTKDEGAILLFFWSGCHANVPTSCCCEQVCPMLRTEVVAPALEP